MKRLLLLTMLMPFSLCGMAQDADAQLTTSYQHSAFVLFNALLQQELPKDNICFSPLSLQMALSMVQNGAAGNTLSQLQQALGTEGFTDEEIGQFNSKLSQTLTERPTDMMKYIEQEAELAGMDPQEMYDGWYPKCELANALWTRPNVHLYDSFVNALRSYYDAGVDAVWFDTWEGIEKINGWVKEHTHELIPKLYDEPQSEDLAVVLMNALYFKGSWSIPFAPENTDKGQFWLNDETYVNVDMMLARDRYDCAITPSFQTITLYYGIGGNFSMTLFVPLEGTTLPPLTFEDWTAAMKPTNLHINLYLPRFEIDGNYDLKKVLQRLGVTDAFDYDRVDFTKMSEVKRRIDKIYQLSKIIVNEEGTEAAALTVIEMPDGMDMTRPEDYQDFKVDRPFYFTIQNCRSNTILFAGRVSHLDGPVEQVNAVTSLVTSHHSSSLFDLSGRSVGSAPARGGVYIKDGRKVVVK